MFGVSPVRPFICPNFRDASLAHSIQYRILGLGGFKIFISLAETPRPFAARQTSAAFTWTPVLSVR